jgi:hypothetical protein
VNETDVRRSLSSVPVDEAAEERAWEVVRSAYAEREPLTRPRRPRFALVFAAVAIAVVAAAFSSPGRAVVNAVRRSIGIEHATPALFRLPGSGRLLVSGPGGTWVVAADGSKRLLGEYTQAAWSPHGLYVVASRANELATMEPDGRIHWTLARPEIRFPRWGGSHADTRIAYLTTSRLHVVGGDGRGDVDAEGLPAAARVAPAWQPTSANRHVLAYVTTRGRVVVLNPDRGSVSWVSAGYAGPRALAWSPDGKRLVLAASSRIVFFDARSGRPRTVAVEGARAVAFAPDGRLALLRSHAVLLLSGTHVRTLFATPGPLVGLAWSPNGRWLLTELPGADQWVFLQTAHGHRVLAVSDIRSQFGGAPTLEGWIG